MLIRCTLPKIFVFLSLIFILTGCNEKERKFEEAEAVCFSALEDLLRQETIAHQEACKAYDNNILMHVKKLETRLSYDGNEARTGITAETSLNEKNSWFEDMKSKYISFRTDPSYEFRKIAKEFETDHQVSVTATQDTLAKLFHDDALQQQCDKLQNTWNNNAENLLNGVNPERADVLHSLINSALDICHFYKFYQPDEGHRLADYTCEFSDSIASVNKRLNDYVSKYRNQL